MRLSQWSCNRETVSEKVLQSSFTKDHSNSSQIVTVNSVHEVDQMKAFYSSRKKAAQI